MLLPQTLPFPRLRRFALTFSLLALCLCLFALPSRAAAPLVVTTTADSGAGSLRAAVANANATSGAVITFDSTVFATRQTIALTSDNFTLSAAMTIQGPVAGVILDGAAFPTKTPPFSAYPTTARQWL